jgi:hypothetical protein
MSECGRRRGPLTLRLRGEVGHRGVAVVIAVIATASCGGTPGDIESSRGATGADGSVRADSSIDSGDPGEAGNEPTVADDSSEGCTGDGIVPDLIGFVAADTNASGITGTWSVYADCDDYAPLEAGVPEPGKTCSAVAAPVAGQPFVPQPGTAQMCTKGSTVQVLADDEWPLRWGAYIALDLNEVGGNAQDFDATAVGIRGFCFYVSGYTVPVFRVRFPTDQGITDRNWYQSTLEYEGWHRVLFSDLGQVDPTNTPFDPSKIVSIEFEIPASRLETVSWDFCIDGLVALR